MKIICFALGHPAHFHLYKNLIQNLKENNCHVYVFMTDKDILKSLLEYNKIDYINLFDNKSSNNTNKFLKLIKSTKALLDHVKRIKPDLLVGCLSQIAYVGKILRIPTIFNAEDDINYTLLQGMITYPFIKHILSPTPTNTGIFKYKTIRYNGYHKLAYLHPNWFEPDRTRVDIPREEKYYLLRFASLNAHHDINVKGISDSIADQLIKLLSETGRVIITSERALPEKFLKYSFSGNINDIHHYLSFADLFIGDSQSMAVEAAILGTPNIRFNSFAGKINVLNELEEKYKLTIGINAEYPDLLFSKVQSMIKEENLRHGYEIQRRKLLSEKIDVTDYFSKLILNYPAINQI